jgi:hypothetical protein
MRREEMIIKDSKTYTKTPLDVFQRFTVNELPLHITYDPNVKWQYHVIRSSVNDGTLIFLNEILKDAMNSLVAGTTCYLKTRDDGKDKYPFYTIGDVEVKHEWGSLEDEIDRTSKEWKSWYAFCQRDTVSIPVKCEYRDEYK